MGNTASAIPNGYQLNQIHLNLTCHSTTNVSVYVDTYLSMLTPLAAAEFYISDINGGVSLGTGFTTGLLDLGIRAGNETLIYPASAYDTTGIGLRQNPNTGNGIGPYRSVDNESSSISLVSVNYTITVAENDNVAYVCDVPENTIAVVGNDGSTKDFMEEPSALVLPAPSVGMKISEANIPFACATDYNSTFSQFNVSMRATIPLTLQNNVTFNIDGFVLFLAVSPEEIRRAQDATGDPEAIVGYFLSKDERPESMYGLGFNLSNASPSLFDMVGHFTPDPPSVASTSELGNFYHIKNDKVTIPFPIDGNLTIGQFTPTAQGVFGMEPLGMIGIIGSYGLSLVDDLRCVVNLPVELFSAIIV